jgi:hypothetical protein
VRLGWTHLIRGPMHSIGAVSSPMPPLDSPLLNGDCGVYVERLQVRGLQVLRKRSVVRIHLIQKKASRIVKVAANIKLFTTALATESIFRLAVDSA